MKGVEIFFDRHIIVYFSTNNDKTKQRVANSLIDNAFELGHTGISAQVMQECIAPTLSSGYDCKIYRFCSRNKTPMEAVYLRCTHYFWRTRL
jgi:hypothetical protein